MIAGRRSFLFIMTIFFFCLKGVSQNNCSCCSENHMAFDFWVGEWRVTNTDGSLAGTNTIVKLQDGCVLKERWENANGKTTGTSMNFYNNITGEWEQLWIDNSGSHLKLKGNKKDNQMILASDEFVALDGKKAVHRITWTSNEDGTVRQLWEVIKEDKFVQTAFDGLYRRIEK